LTRQGDEQKRGACPICRRPGSPEFRPFCSRRCSDVDLQRWFTGAYAIPVVAQDDDGDVPDSDSAE